MQLRTMIAALVTAALAACAPGAPQAGGQYADPDSTLGTLVATVTGLSWPEAVRYDPEQDVYFVANFGGAPSELDNNGFISRIGPDGTVEDLKFIAGGVNGVTLHAPRGMFITGDTLWAADADGVRGFDRRTGAPVAQIDFSAHEPGFLNDIAAGPDGVLHVTDTPGNRIFRIDGRAISVALEAAELDRPNGITWDADGARFIVVAYGGTQAHFAWRPGTTTLETVGTPPGGEYDGVEMLPGGLMVVASQADSSIQVVSGTDVRRAARTSGKPADIGIDTRRRRVAVPYIALHRVDIFQLPEVP